MKERVELRQCPMCGKQAEIISAWDNAYNQVICIAKCTSCTLSMGAFGDEYMAEKSWNTRADSKELYSENQALKADKYKLIEALERVCNHSYEDLQDGNTQSAIAEAALQSKGE